MSPTRPSVLPAVLRLLSLLPLLLPTPPGVRGDCGPPPEVPNAQPILGGSTSFPEKTAITYKCNEGFVKIPGNPDSVVCLSNNQWSEFIEFCNRSCDVPTRLLFASLKKDYNMQNYFPVGSTVEYECRPGYIRNPFQSVKLTCLQNLTWSKAAEFCKKKSCPNPGELRNGDINITTGLFYGSPIFFSCHTGYRLVGESSSYCTLFDRTLKWSEPLPECVEIYCPEPIQIDNGYIQEEQEVYVYRQSITYGCNKGFNLVGKSSIYCTVTEDEGEWSDPPPQCIGKSSGYKPSPTAQKPTTVSVPGTRAPSTPQKPTTTSVPATQRPSVPKATTSFHTTRVTERKETSPSGAVSLIYGKFGSQTVKRNCHHCGMYNPYSWKRILPFNCLRKTIKMQCLGVPKRKWVNAFYQHVVWTPLGTRYVPVYSKSCSCSKVILRQLQITRPINQVVLRAHCLRASF
ncbi:complement decay-accelerating factor isoform X3 [Ictidomys tridecemlineatus]|uniref:complement decay-accelerating factor isoform X3 n=1 Tax=Ictidomys tridecemlineatus TaxID=43179 RepID=UPI000680AF52|nr:complement decay-accelerating factor isoform X3 [Ictidomys tridecemlineatus]KAG3258223.1 CD55 molecule (Cromer blood group), transcript variant X1 [Ictidomys tridecemlineatus]